MQIKIKGKTLKVQPRLGKALLNSRYAKATEVVEPQEVQTADIQAEESNEPEVRVKRQYCRRDMTAE